MKDICFIIKDNKPLTGSVYRMALEGDNSHVTKPGQFINIALPGFYLRRPISVCDKTENGLTIIYKAVGRGTEFMTKMKSGEALCALTGLGNGYDTSLSGAAPVLIGGGVGVPPLYLLAKELIKEGKKVSVVLGFNTCDEVFYEEEFISLGCDVKITTADGSKGIKGFVTAAIPENASYF